jgi:hypothetical protein
VIQVLAQAGFGCHVFFLKCNQVPQSVCASASPWSQRLNGRADLRAQSRYQGRRRLSARSGPQNAGRCCC